MDIDPIQLKCSPIRIDPLVRRCSITGHWRVNDLRKKKGGKCVCVGKGIPFNTSPNIPTRSLSPWQPLDRAVKLRPCFKEEAEELEKCDLGEDDDDDDNKDDDCRQDGGDKTVEPYDYTEDPCHEEVCQCCKRRPFIFNNDHIFDRPLNQRVCHKYVPPTYLVGSNYAGCTSSYNVTVCEAHINPQSQTCGCCLGK